MWNCARLTILWDLSSLLSQNQLARVFTPPDTASHARCWPLATVTRVLSSARVLLNWRVKRTRNSVQCSVFSVQCPGVERAVNTGRGNVPDRPDTRRERTRRLEFNLLFIETQLEWEFEVRDGWMLDCSITWTNFMALLGWNEDKAGRVRNM